MPELPEVETVRLGLEPAMAGRVIMRVVVNRFDLRGGTPVDFADRLTGRRVEALLRRGKYMVMLVEGAPAVVWHLGMSGRVRIYKAGDLYAPETHDHIVFEMEGGGMAVFNDARRFGMMYFATDNWESEPPFAAMGPEPLGNGFSGTVLFGRLAGKRGPIKSALLDQRVVAGLGNIYVCEAMYWTGVSPFRVAGALSAEDCERLAGAIRDVLNAALASGGSSLRDHRQTDGEMGYFQHSFDVYGREGEDCPTCGGVIVRAVQAGRSTFYCQACQL